MVHTLARDFLLGFSSSSPSSSVASAAFYNKGGGKYDQGRHRFGKGVLGLYLPWALSLSWASLQHRHPSFLQAPSSSSVSPPRPLRRRHQRHRRVSLQNQGCPRRRLCQIQTLW